MRTENGIDVDIQAIERILAEGDLITIGFSLFPLRLLVDTRENEHDGQWAGIVEPVASVQERYLWLGKHRGSFGPPRAFAFFVWPKTVRNLVERGTLGILRSRLHGDALRRFDEAVAQALELEREAMKEACRGSRAWPAIWEAQPRA
ncbi:MAG: hypothetical protein K6U88_10915 [Dehalococcoidia bacterium]|jgi:hypothetical protein|uniref:Uncharacterized protein n=1 Tax=Tepidiforma bonchosmolovskayae TaxID=2601677 RepID=A0ABX6C3D8_9CHLR|nr:MULTISPECIES: hypothetical protein [Tepidiforma]MCL6645467.1 hypothetical protein [Dehalococcoidia bacterium]QFG03324.1 hypothetical protein Tbon_08450 [Tepidiforma bonchosmolovskayae]GIW16790.1 MAG: hypothetical protein KatS3mg063_2643 [Tepidiforma sp.]